MSKVSFWDFDGTLGCRIDGLYGKAWSASMLEALTQFGIHDHGLTHDIIEPHLRSGFPWHEPEKGHLHLNDAKKWWAHLRSIYASIFVKLGFAQSQAEALAKEAERRFVDLDRWELYPDTIPVLAQLKQEGWTHLIVSNHVPELSMIVSHLGLTPYIDHIVNSAEVGYEKPNRKIFEAALQHVKHAQPSEIWMIGDNIEADVIGAENMGLNAILVRNQDSRAKHQFHNLHEVGRFLLAQRAK